MSVALVPVKQLAASKTRLHPRLSRGQLEALSLAMLEDVVTALKGATAVARTVVVTPDETVARCAARTGAEALRILEPGLNPSLDAAARSLALAPADALLVVLGDVAGARSEDLDALHTALEALGGPGAVLAPSSDGGTSALLRRPCDLLPNCFGRDSAKAHRDAAARAGVAYRELPLASLAIDLDLPEDVERFLRAHGEGEGARTRALLRDWGWEESRRRRPVSGPSGAP